MQRRSFLGGLMGFGGSLLIGKTENVQQKLEPQNEKSRLQLELNEYGDIIIPGFFTVFVDGEEAFRMHNGDSITAERNCRITAFLGFEPKPTHVWYMHEGDHLTIETYIDA